MGCCSLRPPRSDNTQSFQSSQILLTTPTEGYYADSILKFRIQFPTDYPSRAPSVTFITDIFHPLISQKDGSLNLSVRFPHWRCVRGRLFSLHDNHLIVHNRPKQDHIFHVLHWIKVVFKKQTLDNLNEADCLNKEAFKWVSCLVHLFSSLYRTVINF